MALFRRFLHFDSLTSSLVYYCKYVGIVETSFSKESCVKIEIQQDCSRVNIFTREGGWLTNTEDSVSEKPLGSRLDKKPVLLTRHDIIPIISGYVGMHCRGLTRKLLIPISSLSCCSTRRQGSYPIVWMAYTVYFG